MSAIGNTPRGWLMSIWVLVLTSAASVIQAGMVDKTGMKPWEICAMCHGLDGVSAMDRFPILAGQKASYIRKQLDDFSRDARDNDGGQMSAMVTEIEPGDVDAIVHYFAAQIPPLPVPVVNRAEYERGEQLYLGGDGNTRACIGCHGNTDSAAPWLQAQHRRYLQKQLLDFRSGARGNDDGVMVRIAGQLRDRDIDALAEYLSSASRPQSH